MCVLPLDPSTPSLLKKKAYAIFDDIRCFLFQKTIDISEAIFEFVIISGCAPSCRALEKGPGLCPPVPEGSGKGEGGTWRRILLTTDSSMELTFTRSSLSTISEFSVPTCARPHR